MEHTLTDNSAGPAGRFRNSNLAQAWLVLVLALIFGAILAAIQVKLSPIIAANKMNETLEKIPELVWGDAAARHMAAKSGDTQITPGTIEVQKNGTASFYSLFQVTSKGEPAGWVVKTTGQGYADRIELLMGFNPEVTAITGLFILEQKETPGLGAKIVLPHWQKQFIGKETDPPLTVVKNGVSTSQGIDAITGATISSRSVVGMVNRTMDDLAGKLTASSVRFSQKVVSHE
jgi:electron transport complex protein RnfG